MDIITTLINTFLLLALFWYQKNKNKVLEDRIEKQSDLLHETKDVVTNQAQAIGSQKIVVDTALEYSKAFDLKKIESIIKREADLEFQAIINEQNDTINKHQQTIKITREAIKKAIEQVMSDYAVPLTIELLTMLFFKSDKEREMSMAI